MDKVRNLGIVEENAYHLRLQKNLTQKEFASLLGISKSYLSDMENGYRTMSIHHINKLCNEVNVSFDFMFGFSKSIRTDIIKIDHINLTLLGNHLKELRKELNITQEKMANKLNISRSMVTLYETGERTIKTDDLKQICELSGYSADYCVGKLEECIQYKKIKKIKPKEIRELMKA